MNIFSESKSAKLKRKPVLRLFNALGMVHWELDDYGEAQQYLRILHPLSLLWFLVMAIIAIITYGIPKGCEDLRYCMKYETVWF
jgi:hypothetical protein